MLLVLTEKQKEHLSLLTNVSEDVAKEFCRIAVDFIQNGINSRKYLMASQKLNLDVKEVQQCTEGIMYILTECTKLQINHTDFHDSISSLGLPDEINECLLQYYLSNQDKIKTILNEMALALPCYDNLEWRFDVQLASRMLSYQTIPKMFLKLGVKKGQEQDVYVLQTDPLNLIHLANVLEEALAEIKTAHCRRITRSIR